MRSQALALLLLVSIGSLSCASGESVAPTAHAIPTPMPTMLPSPSTDKPFTQKAEITTRVGHLREDKNSKSRILKSLPEYTWVEVIGRESEWLNVMTLRGETGWLHRSSARLLAPLPPATTYGTVDRYSSGSSTFDERSNRLKRDRELYEEIERRKREHGLTTRQAVRELLQDMGEIR